MTWKPEDGRPRGSSAEEWQLWLQAHGVRQGLPFISVQIARAIEEAEGRGYREGTIAGSTDAREGR